MPCHVLRVLALVAAATAAGAAPADDGAPAPIEKGSAEKAGKPENHVLAAIGLDRAAAREVVRLSFACDTAEADAEAAAAILVEEAQALRAQAPRGAARR